MKYRIEEKESLRFYIKKIFFGSGSHRIELPQYLHLYFKDNVNLMEFIQFGIMDHSTHVLTYAMGMSHDKVDDLPNGFEVLKIDWNTWAIILCKGILPDSVKSVMDTLDFNGFHLPGYHMLKEWKIEFYPEGDIASSEYECELWIPVIKKERKRN